MTDQGYTPILEVKNATKTYGEAKAIDNLSISIRESEFVTLLGPSGCGKTTLLRSIAGFVSLDAGSILIRQQDMTTAPPYKRSLGMVFQSLALFPHMTVQENISYGLSVRGASRKACEKRTHEVLELVALQGFGGRRIHELSGGQQQRVALARALATDPDVLLLDEPLSALDLKLKRHLQIELKRIQRQTGTTFLFVTHDQEEALGMSDRIAVVNQGRIEQFASASTVYSRPTTSFVANFIGDSNLFQGRVIECRGESLLLDIADFGHVWASGEASLGDLVTVLVRPEQVSVGDAAACHMDWKSEGCVVEEHYAGSMRKLKLRVGKTFVSALVGGREAATPFLNGRLSLGWSSNDCYVLPQEG